MLADLKNERITIGIKQSKKAILAGEVKSLFVAEDADSGIINEILLHCSSMNIEVNKVQSMSHLGKSAGIDVSAAVVAVLK